MEIRVLGFNYFILMNMVYQPRWRELVAHTHCQTPTLQQKFLMSVLYSVASFLSSAEPLQHKERQNYLSTPNSKLKPRPP
jgi:uncharacterized membrane protein